MFNFKAFSLFAVREGLILDPSEHDIEASILTYLTEKVLDKDYGVTTLRDMMDDVADLMGLPRGSFRRIDADIRREPALNVYRPLARESKMAANRSDDGRERAPEPLFAPHARRLTSGKLLAHLLLDVSSLREARVHDDSEALARLELRSSGFHAGRSPNFEGAAQ